jgi:hypothetical protein
MSCKRTFVMRLCACLRGGLKTIGGMDVISMEIFKVFEKLNGNFLEFLRNFEQFEHKWLI